MPLPVACIVGFGLALYLRADCCEPSPPCVVDFLDRGCVESFNGKLRDGLLNPEISDTLHEGQVLQPEIPAFEVPPFEGERYGTMAPDTLDLAERAQWAMHAMTENPEPAADRSGSRGGGETRA